MITVHATQKLLNTSGLEARLYVWQADGGQMLHSWYAGLVGTGFRGKTLVMYVHEPSLLTIVCRGKSIKGTWPEFRQRVPELLKRYSFKPPFIEFETALSDEYVVSKTNNRSVPGHMNGMKEQLEYTCSQFERYEDIEQNLLEEYMMDWMYPNPKKKYSYITPREYWKEHTLMR